MQSDASLCDGKQKEKKSSQIKVDSAQTQEFDTLITKKL